MNVFTRNDAGYFNFRHAIDEITQWIRRGNKGLFSKGTQLVASSKVLTIRVFNTKEGIRQFIDTF
jgi:hypothetical protein